jgi:hypothetical protein
MSEQTPRGEIRSSPTDPEYYIPPSRGAETPTFELWDVNLRLGLAVALIVVSCVASRSTVRRLRIRRR